MPSFQDSAVIFFLALLLFGPKKLPELARQLGKLMGEFRRASSEFRLQMEDELRASEQEERRKQIAAIENTAPKPTATLPESSTPPHASSDSSTELALPENTIAPPLAAEANPVPSEADFALAEHPHAHLSAPAPAPIASSGDLNMMAPASGLPVARNSNGAHPSPASLELRQDTIATGTATASSADLAPAFASIPHLDPRSPAAGDTSEEPPAPPDRRYRAAPAATSDGSLVSPAEPAPASHG